VISTSKRSTSAEHHLDLLLGQVGSEAVVDAATAEGHVRVRVPLEVEPKRLGEGPLIAVPRRVPHDDPVAGRDQLGAELDVAGRGATEEQHGACPPEDLLGRGAPDPRIAAEQRQLLGRPC
jgi:hypothetical protein